MVCPPAAATSEAEARWPRFGLVVVATTSRRDNKDQMIRPLVILVPPRLGHLAPASEVVGGHTLPF
jgi:hypothetical protein